MYTIYADGKPLYIPHLFNEGYGVFSPKVTVELNKAGSLDLTIPPNNVMYDDIAKLKTIVNVFQNGDDEIFRGRVLHDEKDFYKQKKTYCEGELAFLLDSTQRPYTFSGKVDELFKQYIANHNARVDADKRFVVGRVTIATDTEITCENYNYPTTFDEINTQILETVGGHLKLRSEGGVKYIDLIADSSEDGTVDTTSQIIEFGVNLLDITEYITAENIFTVIVPVGAQLTDSEGNQTNNKLNISSVNNGKDYIENAEAIKLFGRIERMVEWSDVESPSELKKLGEEMLAKNIEMAVTLTVNAVDLHILNIDTESIHIGDWVRVISIPHGLDKQFKCTKIVYDLQNPDQNEYSFGVDYTTLTSQQVTNKKDMQNSVSTVLSTAGAVTASAQKVSQVTKDVENVIATMPTDYVKTETFESYQTEVEEDFSDMATKYEELLTRVIMLEGGTT